MSDLRSLASSIVAGSLVADSLTEEERRFLASGPHAGVTLFARNLRDGNLEGLTKLIRDVQLLRTVPEKCLVAIDQEGGRVARIKGPGFDPGPAMALGKGKTDAAALTEIEALAQSMGKNLRRMGINCDFAPVMDVLTWEGNHAIGNRAFGTTAEAVCLRGPAFLRGLQASGVLGCLKHFPGQGDARVDTHEGRAEVAVSRAQLKTRELAPFSACLHEAPMVMISHCVYPALDVREASRSAVIMQTLLRKEMGFAGVIVSDDLCMGAVSGDLVAWQAYIVEAVAAGADLLLVCKGLDRWNAAIEALETEASRHAGFRHRLEEASQRVRKMRKRLA